MASSCCKHGLYNHRFVNDECLSFVCLAVSKTVNLEKRNKKTSFPAETKNKFRYKSLDAMFAQLESDFELKLQQIVLSAAAIFCCRKWQLK